MPPKPPGSRSGGPNLDGSPNRFGSPVLAQMLKGFERDATAAKAQGGAMDPQRALAAARLRDAQEAQRIASWADHTLYWAHQNARVRGNPHWNGGKPELPDPLPQVDVERFIGMGPDWLRERKPK